MIRHVSWMQRIAAATSVIRQIYDYDTTMLVNNCPVCHWAGWTERWIKHGAAENSQRATGNTGAFRCCSRRTRSHQSSCHSTGWSGICCVTNYWVLTSVWPHWSQFQRASYAIAIAILSVCLSETSVNYVKTAQDTNIQFSPYCRVIFLVYWVQNLWVYETKHIFYVYLNKTV